MGGALVGSIGLVILIVLVVIVIAAFFIVGVYNGLQRLRVATESALSGIDVQL